MNLTAYFSIEETLVFSEPSSKALPIVLEFIVKNKVNLLSIADLVALCSKGLLPSDPRNVHSRMAETYFQTVLRGVGANFLFLKIGS